MACGCRGGSRAGSTTPSGATVEGFDFIPPGGGEPIRFLTSIEAKQERRRRGGGTIHQITSG